ncbi:MAG: hypothetical protein IPJ14_21910 [Kineosporiaceae bacterium]|nr:hypothetical protein [Kineosporiaceae bacterium]
MVGEGHGHDLEGDDLGAPPPTDEIQGMLTDLSRDRAQFLHSREERLRRQVSELLVEMLKECSDSGVQVRATQIVANLERMQGDIARRHDERIPNFPQWARSAPREAGVYRTSRPREKFALRELSKPVTGPEAIEWTVEIVASGVVGNLAYDAIKIAGEEAGQRLRALMRGRESPSAVPDSAVLPVLNALATSVIHQQCIVHGLRAPNPNDLHFEWHLDVNRGTVWLVDVRSTRSPFMAQVQFLDVVHGWNNYRTIMLTTGSVPQPVTDTAAKSNVAGPGGTPRPGRGVADPTLPEPAARSWRRWRRGSQRR